MSSLPNDWTDLISAAIYVKVPIILLCWLQLMVLIGIGHLVTAYVLRLKTDLGPLALSAAHNGVVGVTAVALIGMAWHLFLPLDSYFATVVGVIGLAGAFLALRPLACGKLSKAEVTQLAIMLAIGAFAALASARNFVNHGDSGLYHIPTLILNSASSIEIGAANVHMRFGYNSILYPLAGAFFYPGLGASSSEIINATLTALFVGAIFASIKRRYVSDALTIVAGGLLLFHLCRYTSMAQGQGTASTDWPAFLAASFCVVMGFRLAVDIDAKDNAGRTGAHLLLLCCAAIMAVTIKLTQLLTPMIAVTGLFLCWRASRQLTKPVKLAFGTMCVVFAFWTSRGLLLSGCLLYPVSRSCVASLPWTLNLDMARDDLAYMASFGKVPQGAAPDKVPAFSVWFPNWLSDFATQSYAQEMFAIVGLALAFVVLRVLYASNIRTLFESCGPNAKMMTAAIMAVAIGNVVVWLLVAPLARYGEASVITLAVVLATAAFPIPIKMPHWLVRADAMVSKRNIAAFIILLYAVVGSAGLFARQNTLTANVWPRLPAIETTASVSQYGLPYVRPADKTYLCWAAPQPCSYYAITAGPKQRFFIWNMIPNGDRNKPAAERS